MLDQPTLIYEPYCPETCAMHCVDGWLPSKGTEDAIYLDDVEGEYLPLLMPPYEFIPCPACSVGLNPDLDCRPEAVAAAIPTVPFYQSHCL